MKKLTAILIVFAGLIALVRGQEARIIGHEELQNVLVNSSDTLYVINFWATWCGPCVTELPYFQEVSEQFRDDKIKFLLVSLDFPSQYESRLIPFIKDKSITLEVVLLNELDYGKWMPSVDEHWKGNIPATLIFNNYEGLREFIPKALEKQELVQLIENNLKINKL